MAILEKLKQRFQEGTGFLSAQSPIGKIITGAPPKEFLSSLYDSTKKSLNFPNREDFAKLQSLTTTQQEREQIKNKIVNSGLIFGVGTLKKIVPALETAQTQIKQSPVVQKLLSAIKEAKPARKELSKLQSAERARRAGAVAGIFERETGEAAHLKALGKLKGELVSEGKKPMFEGLRVEKETTKEQLQKAMGDINEAIKLQKNAPKIADPLSGIKTKDDYQKYIDETLDWVRNKQFKGLREGKEAISKINQQDADELVKTIQQHPVLDDVFEKIHATEGLRKIFDGEIPQPSQLSLLEEVFGSDLIKEIMGKRPLGKKIFDIIEDVVNIPKSLMASFDASAHLRQGVLLSFTRPKAAFKASVGAFKETFSEANFEKWLSDLKLTPEYKLMKRSELYIAEPNKIAGGIAGREERFMSNLAEKIPFIGKIVKASGRNYAAFLNKMRVDTFNTFSKELIERGKSFADNPQDFKDLADFINTATGRGKLAPFVARIGAFMNALFFSPRLIAARFSMLNPVWYAKQSPQVRKIAIKNFAKFVGVGSTFVFLASQIDGVTVETNPQSTDFMKIRYGNTRWDIWGGFQQWVRVISQLATGARKTQKGDIIPLSKKKFPFETRLDVAERFFRGKFAPIPALTLELLEGQKMFGDELKFSREAVEKLTPLYLADMKDAFEEFGPSALFITGIPAFFGVGVQTYEEKTQAGNPFNLK